LIDAPAFSILNRGETVSELGKLVVSSFKFHLLSFCRSIQDYKIDMDMKIVIFLESRAETNLEVYSNLMVQYSI
jgi:hypothetical protein